MRLLSAPAILSVAVVAALLLPAGAIVGTMGSPTDALFDGEPSVEMTAHDGPNGEYVVAAEDDELKIDFTDPGVNTDAFTGAERVFDLQNTDTTNVTVWMTHDGDDHVTLYDDATGAPIESEGSAVELAPGEVITVSIDIDSTGAVAGDQLLSTVTLHAKFDADLPDFGVAIDDISEEVTEGETVTVGTTVTNDGDAAGDQTVELVVDGAVVDQREVSLDPGESTTVEFSFEAGSDDANVTVRTGDRSSQRTVTVTAPAGSGGGGGIGAGGGEAGEEAADEISPEEEVTEGEEAATGSETVEVEFETEGEGAEGTDTGGGDAPQVTVTELSTEALDNQNPESSTQALITDREGRGDPDETDNETPPEEGDTDGEDAAADSEALDTGEELESDTYDTLTTVGEPTDLSGERSKIGVAEGINDRDRVVKLVDIDPGPERENSPATVRMRVDADRFGDGDPAEASIGHETEDGWELLETRVVERTDGVVILEARTPGFSRFAAFADTNVQYEWTLPDGTVLEGRQIDPSFEEPGFYEIQLTVTDAFGRQSTDTHRVLANDVPEATVEVVGREGDQVTLAANVQDEVGETEVTWTFPDGTEKTGETVNHTLEEGEHEIDLHVVDEYGAESETEHTVAVGPPGASPQVVADALGMDLELVVQMGLVSGIGLALAVGYRQFPWGIFSPSRRRGPKITVFRTPMIDVSARRFVIEELTVEDPTCELDTITIGILEAGGRSVIEKRLDVSGMTSYTASPETLTVPPGVDIDPEGSYTVRIKTTDTDGRSAERNLSATPGSDRRSERRAVR